MILYNDRLIPREEAHIDVEDRGYQFGDGVYEVIRIYHRSIFALEEHLERLERSAKEIRMDLPCSKDTLTKRLHELIEYEKVEEGIIYLQVTRGYAPRSHPIPADSQPLLTASAKSLPRPAATMKNGVKTILIPDARWLRCDIKSLNLLGSVLAKQEALDHGAFEAILHRDGTVTEGSSTNVMIVKNGVLLTHPANHLILHGITRSVILKLAEKLSIPVAEAAFSTEQLLTSDEVFLSGTTVEVTPVIQIGERTIGDGLPGAVTRQLQGAFEDKIM